MFTLQQNHIILLSFLFLFRSIRLFSAKQKHIVNIWVSNSKLKVLQNGTPKIRKNKIRGKENNICGKQSAL